MYIFLFLCHFFFLIFWHRMFLAEEGFSGITGVFCLCFWGRVLLCSLRCPQTHDPSASTPWVLELQTWTTTPSSSLGVLTHPNMLFQKSPNMLLRRANIKLQCSHTDVLIIVAGRVLVVCRQQCNYYISDFELLDKQIYSWE